MPARQKIILFVFKKMEKTKEEANKWQKKRRAPTARRKKKKKKKKKKKSIKAPRREPRLEVPAALGERDLQPALGHFHADHLGSEASFRTPGTHPVHFYVFTTWLWLKKTVPKMEPW